MKKYSFEQPKSLFSGLSQSTALLILSVLGVPILASAAIADQSSQLSIQVEGMRDQKGQICMTLFDRQQGFPDQENSALQSQCITATASQPTITFQGLSPGGYAVAVLHDSNNDYEANRNFLGIPSEGFGFSGNPVIRSGPPQFNEALVLVAGPRTDIQIQLNYF